MCQNFWLSFFKYIFYTYLFVIKRHLLLFNSYQSLPLLFFTNKLQSIFYCNSVIAIFKIKSFSYQIYICIILNANIIALKQGVAFLLVVFNIYFLYEKLTFYSIKAVEVAERFQSRLLNLLIFIYVRITEHFIT